MVDLGGRPPEYRVFGLVDGRTGKVVWVDCDRRDRPPRWLAVWEHRDQFDTALSRILRSQTEKPTETVFLGAGTGLHARTARVVADLVRGWFLVEQQKTPGRRRRVAKIGADGTVRVWPSQAAAARSLHVTRGTVWRDIRTGGFIDLG